MQPTNLLYILSDQHNRGALGCYGHPLVQTPNLDRLAARGTRFTNAYTTCPICVPARASLATGRYVHQIGYWDNAFPYDGAVPSWHHRLRAQGHQVDVIGKLHFRSADDDNGWSREIEPLHVVDGIGDALGCIRENAVFRNKREGIDEAGPGDSTYLQYDARNADNAVQWLENAPQDGKPWALFLSLVCPHPPYIAPQELFDLYPPDDIPLPPQWREEDWPDHPAIDYFRRYFTFDSQFDETTIRRMNAAYYGVVTYLDQQIGRVLSSLEANGLSENTRIVYTTDHGEHLGARGIFGKFTMYEESAAVPLILAGPDVPAGKVCATPVSLIDTFPSVVEAVGATHAPEDADLPGASWWQIAQEPDQERTVFSEYHALGTEAGIYMLRNRRYKYVHYTHQQPQLFDLLADPDECVDLAASPQHQPVLAAMEAELRVLLNPEAVDAQAKADQKAKVASLGGEEFLRRRGSFENSPVPGEKPKFKLV
ncbi:MAG: sulfatase-like hydrolase/transferase [Caldilineaceae bacterium]|nr:sulfatase-like hydrolase/transferase [Caldilineaceae bacterium]